MFLGLIIGFIYGATFIYILFLIISKGRINYIFSEDSYKCGLVKILGDTPNVTSLYDSGYAAASHLHGCNKPKKFIHHNKTYTLNDDGHYY